MGKQIIATNIDGLLIEHEAFIEPHKDWFKRAIEKTGDSSLEKWIGKENYFLGVNEAMEKIMPKASATSMLFTKALQKMVSTRCYKIYSRTSKNYK